MPGKGYSVIFRLYVPLKPWYDKTWRPGEIELVNWLLIEDGRYESQTSSNGAHHSQTGESE